MASTELQERAAQNQSRFRDYNESIEPHNRAVSWSDPPMPDWACECAFQCAEPVQMTIGEYEAVRSQASHFLVVPHPDHVVNEVERVVARHDRYWIVEKQEHAAEVSEDLDPRAA